MAPARPHRATTKRPLPLAYASVGKSGDFGGANKDTSEDAAQTWTFTAGVGWLYGLGICIGPFFGTGVGFTIPGGVLAGAGGGVGVVVGIGMGSGLLWGSGRGVVRGLGVIPPMTPPFAEGLPRPADLPSPQELLRRAGDAIDTTRARVARRTAERRRNARRPPPVAFALPPSPRPLLDEKSAWDAERGGHRRAVKLTDPRWVVQQD